MENDGNIIIPAKVVVDTTSAERDIDTMAAEANRSLKRIGSDRSLSDLDKSVKKAFDSGVTGADKLMASYAKNKMSLIKLTGQVSKLGQEYAKLSKERVEAYNKANSLENEFTKNRIRTTGTDQEKGELAAYEAAKAYTKEKEKEFYAAQNVLKAAQAKLEIEGQLKTFYAEEAKFQQEVAKIEEKRAQLDIEHGNKVKAIEEKYGMSWQDIQSSYSGIGRKSNAYKELEALDKEYEKVAQTLQEPIPPKGLEEMRETLTAIINTFRHQLEKVDSSFSTENIIDQVKLLKQELDSMTKGVIHGNIVKGENRYIDSSVYQRVADTGEKLSEAQQILETSRNIVSETVEEYAKQDGEVQSLDAKISDIVQKTSALEQNEDAITKQMEKQADMADMGTQSSGGMFGGAGTIKDDNSIKKIFSWQRVFTIMGRSVQELGRNMQKLGAAAKNALIYIGRLAVNLTQMGAGAVLKGISKVSSRILEIRKNIASSIPSLKKVVKFLTRYILGFRSLFFLVRKIRAAIGEGFKAMALVDESVNKSISNMMTALNQLKGQIGASFAPLLNTIAPILVEIINLATKAMVAVGAFLATLTGQHTFKVAVAEQVDYAESLKGTASAAKDAAKAIDEYLSPLDELNRMDAPDDGKKGGGGGAGGGNDLGVTYQEVDVNELGISDFAKRLKKAWEDQDWKGVGKVISDELDNAVIKPLTEKLSWKNIGSKIQGFNDIATGIINGFFEVEDTFSDLGTLVGTAITTGLKTINDFIGKVNFAQIGKDFALTVKGAIDEIDPKDVATYFTDKFKVVFETLNGFIEQMNNDGTFNEIAVKIARTINGIDWYGIFTSIFTFGRNIGRAFIDAITGFLEGGGFSTMLTEIARAINDEAKNLTPDKFAEAAHIIGEAFMSVLTDIDTFLGDTEGAFDNLLDGIGTFITELPWEDIFKNSGKIVSKIINALVAVINKISGSLNEVQDNGKTLATNIGVAIGEGLANIDFEQMGEAFGLFGEAIIDGIVGAISGTGGVTKIIQALVKGFNEADAGGVEAIVGAAIWFTVAGKIVEGIGKALPLVLSANQAIPGGLFNAIATQLGGAVSTGAGGGFTALATSLGAALPIIGLVVAALAVLVGGLVTFTTAVEDTRAILQETYDTYIGPIMDNIQAGWDSMCEQFEQMYAEYIQPTVDNIAKQFQELWDGHLKSVFESVTEYIGKVIEIVSLLWKEWLSPLITYVISTIAPTVSWIINHVVNLITGLAKIVGSAFAFIMDEMNIVLDFLLFVFTGDWETFCTNIQEDTGKLVEDIGGYISAIVSFVVNNLVDIANGLVTVLNTLGDSIESFVNSAIGDINTALEAMGKDKLSKFSIPNIPSVPYLAKGAVIPANQPFLAALGDQKYGKNLEAPEGLIRQIMREELAGAGGAGNNTYHVQATIQRRVLFDTIIDEAKLRQQASGANPFDLM